MDELIQLLPFIFVALTLLARFFRRKKPQNSESEVPLEDEQEVTLPPWGNIETMDGNTSDSFPDFLEADEPSPKPVPSLTVAEESQPPPDTPAPKPVERPPLNQTEERRKVTPVYTAPTTIAGISLTPQTFRQGIILREILGPPKSLQRRRTESEN